MKQSSSQSIFCEEFSNKLSTYINIDLARVKKVPDDAVASFMNVLKENNKNIEFINGVEETHYGILKIKKYRVVLFYVDNREKKQCYVASEISEKRILNYIQYLKKR